MGEVDVDGTEATVALEIVAGIETATVGVEGGVTDFSFSPTYEIPEYVDESEYRTRIGQA